MEDAPKPKPSATFATPVARRSLESVRPTPLRMSLPPSARTPTGSNFVRPSLIPERSLSGAKVKGINFTGALSAVQRLYGVNARNRVQTETPGDLGNALKYGGLVVGGWYPVEWYQDLWSSFRTLVGADEVAARRIGHLSTEVSFHTLYRMFARLTSPSMLLGMASRAFRNYYDTGRLNIKTSGKSALVAEFTGCTGFSSLMWHELLGGCGYFVESSGVRNVELSILEGAGDKDWMIARARWRE